MSNERAKDTKGEIGGTDAAQELLSRRQLADYLGVNERTVDRLRHRGLPAPYRVSSSPRWRKSEIDAWLNKQQEGVRQ